MACGHHAAWPSPHSGHPLPHVIMAVALPHMAWPSTRCTHITQQQLNICVQSALSELKLGHGKGAVLTEVINHFMHFDTLTKHSPVNSENYSYSLFLYRNVKIDFKTDKKNLQLQLSKWNVQSCNQRFNSKFYYISLAHISMFLEDLSH